MSLTMRSTQPKVDTAAAASAMAPYVIAEVAKMTALMAAITVAIANAQRSGMRVIAPTEEAEYSSKQSTDLTATGPGFGAQNQSGAKVHPYLAGKPALDGAPNNKKATLPHEMPEADINQAASQHDLVLAPGLTLEHQPTNAPTPTAAPAA